MCIILRPHHLLCTQGFEGKGYNNEFASRMSLLVNRFRSEKETEIRISFSTDDLCSHCPNKVSEGVCASQEKVKELDKKVIQNFGLEEKDYCYQELIKEIDSKMAPSLLDNICGKCEWYKSSLCKKNILSGKYV